MSLNATACHHKRALPNPPLPRDPESHGWGCERNQKSFGMMTFIRVSGGRRSILSVADVLLLAVDSWGGVASMIALAGGLRDLGVSTRIAAYSDFGDKVRAAGCDFVDLEVSLADWWESQNARQSDWAKNPLRTLKALRAGGKGDARATAARLADIVKPGEGIVSGTLSVGTAAGVAALRGSQVVAVHPAPMTPSHLAEGTLDPVTRRPSLANEWSGRLAARGAGWILRRAVNEGRQALGLPPWTARDYLSAVSQVPTVYGVSPAVMPADPAWPASGPRRSGSAMTPGLPARARARQAASRPDLTEVPQDPNPM